MTLSSCIGAAAEVHVQPGSSIQAAINNANAGDVVIVEPGTYNESINIKKIDLTNFVLRAASDNPADTIIAGNNTGVHVITVEFRNNITIKGFTITGAGNDRAGIYLNGCRYCTIENNVFVDDALGVFLKSSPYGVVRNNRLTKISGIGNGRGINVEGSINTTVSDNQISDQKYGIYVTSGSHSSILSGNTVKDSTDDGIVIEQTSNTVIERNTVNSTKDFGIYLTGANENIVKNNVVSKSNNGINLVGSSRNTISNNAADSANHSIFMNTSHNNNLQNNTVSNSPYGMAMRYSNNNNITDNYAYNNNIGTGNAGFYFTLTSNGNKISGNKAKSNFNGFVLANGAYNNILENNEANENANFGIYVESAGNNKIVSNTVSQNARGINLLGVASNGNTISANLVDTNYGDGIRLENASNNYINSNYIRSSSGNGIYLVNSNYSHIDSNTALGNDKGIYLMNSIFDKVSNNIVSNNYKQGIMLSLADNNTVSRNTASSCSEGISLNSSIDNNVSSNTMEWNTNWGIFLCVRSTSNLIYDNNFYNNVNANSKNGGCTWYIARTTGRNIMGGPRLGGNYWGKPGDTGHSQITPDANNDGFADSPYAQENVVDNYPLIDVPDPVVPVADINTNVTSGYAPLIVQFSDNSQGATTWNWDFGYDKNSISNEPSPVYTYSTPGNYTVKLTASNANGTTTDTQLIPVQRLVTLPVANLSTNVTSGYAPLIVQFNDISQNADLRYWDFGDGTNSTEPSPVHTYSVANTYNVVLTVSNGNGTAAASVPITVKEKSTSSGSNSGGSSGSSHSSGGSGGGAGGSPEPAKNVKVKELSQTFITSGKPIKFDLAKNATCIVNLSFDSKKTVGKTTTIVEMLKNKSTLTPDAPEGEVYNYLNIWVGNGGFGSDEKNLENAVVNFRVEKAWTQDKGIDKSSIVLNRYSDKKWNELPTTFLREDDKYMYFKAESPGFSPFAITGEASDKETVTEESEKGTVTEVQNKPEDLEENNKTTASEAEQKPESEENTGTSEKGSTSTPGFEVIYGISGLLAVFLYKRK